MTAKTKRIFTVLLAFLGVAALVAPTFAWFVNYWLSSGAGFNTGFNASMPNVTMWMYYSKSDGATTEGWEEYTSYKKYEEDDKKYRLDVTDPNIFIPSVQVDDSKTTYEYVYESLHFGKVDNLVALRDDNKIYMRFEFNIKDHGGNMMKISLKYNASGYTYTENSSVLDAFHLYKINAAVNDDTPGDTDTEKKYNAAKQDLYTKHNVNKAAPDYIIKYNERNPAAMQFVQFKYAISEKGNLAPGTEDFDALLANATAVPVNCGRHSGTCPCTCKLANCAECAAGNHSKCEGAAATEDAAAIPACTACDNGKCGSIEIHEHTSGLNMVDGKYYLYIELTPLLDAFGMQENILDYFVPSYMLFDVKFDIEIG